MFYLGNFNVSKTPDLFPSFSYLTMKSSANRPTGLWIKLKDVNLFRIKPDIYNSILASSGKIIENRMCTSTSSMLKLKNQETLKLSVN